jgi:hypothetical protein
MAIFDSERTFSRSASADDRFALRVGKPWAARG